jgi:hypothetical protein
MAYGDYQHCAKCDAKSFYDANVNWEAQNVQNDGYAPEPDGVMSLCKDCYKTHMLVVVERPVVTMLKVKWPAPESET